MKLTHAATVAAIALAALTGCASQAPAPTPTPTPTPTAEAPALTGADAAFIHFVRGHAPALSDAADADLIDVGRKACAALDDGNTPAAVVQAINDSGASADRQRAMEVTVGAAITDYCPAHLNEIGADK